VHQIVHYYTCIFLKTTSRLVVGFFDTWLHGGGDIHGGHGHGMGTVVDVRRCLPILAKVHYFKVHQVCTSSWQVHFLRRTPCGFALKLKF